MPIPIKTASDIEGMRLAGRLATLDPAVVTAIRRCLRAAHGGSLAAGIALERRLGLGLQARR